MLNSRPHLTTTDVNKLSQNFTVPGEAPTNRHEMGTLVRKDYNWRVALRIFANQTACWLLVMIFPDKRSNFTSKSTCLNAHLA